VRGGGGPARAGLRPAATGQHGGGGDDCAGDRRGRGSTAVAVAGGARGPPGGGGGDGATTTGREFQGAVKMQMKQCCLACAVKIPYVRWLTVGHKLISDGCKPDRRILAYVRRLSDSRRRYFVIFDGHHKRSDIRKLSEIYVFTVVI
jgi:hypothetical protein